MPNYAGKTTKPADCETAVQALRRQHDRHKADTKPLWLPDETLVRAVDGALKSAEGVCETIISAPRGGKHLEP